MLARDRNDEVLNNMRMSLVGAKDDTRASDVVYDRPIQFYFPKAAVHSKPAMKGSPPGTEVPFQERHMRIRVTVNYGRAFNACLLISRLMRQVQPLYQG